MRISPQREVLAAVVVGVLLLAGCSTQQPQRQSSPESAVPTESAPPAAASGKLVSARVGVPAGLAQAPLDQPRQALIPDGWTISVWARIPMARLETWTPDGALLVSVPRSGQIVKLTPKPAAAPQQSTLLGDLDQPHGMAFAGTTLYVAESDEIDAYDYADGAPATAGPSLPAFPTRAAPICTAPTRMR